MLVLIELIGSLVLIGICTYGAIKLIESWFNRTTNQKDPE